MTQSCSNPVPHHIHTPGPSAVQQQQSVTMRQMKETGRVVLLGVVVSQTPARFPPPRQLLVMPLILLGVWVVVVVTVMVGGLFTL